MGCPEGHPAAVASQTALAEPGLRYWMDDTGAIQQETEQMVAFRLEKEAAAKVGRLCPFPTPLRWGEQSAAGSGLVGSQQWGGGAMALCSGGVVVVAVMMRQSAGSPPARAIHAYWTGRNRLDREREG